MVERRSFKHVMLQCPECPKLCKNAGGLTKHRKTAHPTLPAAPLPPPVQNHHHDPDNLPPPEYFEPAPSPPPSPDPPQSPQRGVTIERHPILDGTPCDAEGYDLDPGDPPPPWEEHAADDFSPLNQAIQRSKLCHSSGYIFLLAKANMHTWVSNFGMTSTE
ncbi:hypothetical protein C8R43DRAFT_952193 [Mycena crocata]|nr:hypothetical protein C8R43DRAFT_952193 [Mycena crocata]